jgi:hypothetical protein
MKTIGQLANLRQSRRLEPIARYLQSSVTRRLYIDDLEVTERTAAMQTVRQEK